MSKYLFVVVMSLLVMGLPLYADSDLTDEPEPCVVGVWADIAQDETALGELMEDAGEGCIVFIGTWRNDDVITLSLPALGSSWAQDLDDDDLTFISFHVWCEEGSIKVGYEWSGSPIRNDNNEGTPVSYVFDDAFTLSADHRESLSTPAFMEALRVMLLASNSLRVLTKTDDGADTEAAFDIRALSANMAEYPECST